MTLASLLSGPFALPLAALTASVLDRALGEPRRAHPLVAFGAFAQKLEARFNRHSVTGGMLAWALAVLPWVALAAAVRPFAPFVVDVVLLWFALGARSLAEHARAVAAPLAAGDLAAARAPYPGGFRVALIDELDRIDAAAIRGRAKLS